MIQEIEIKLKRVGKKSRAEKMYPIEILQFGEKVKGPELTAQHHFFSSSPLLYLPENSPLRSVYLGVQAEYYKAQHRAVQKFTGDILELKNKYAQDSSAVLTEVKRWELLTEIDGIIKESQRDMLSLIQLEVGEYEVSMKITYEAPGFKLWKRRKESCSSISFSVEEQALSNWKEYLDKTLRVQATNLLGDTQSGVSYPELQPVDFQELARTS